MLRAFSGGKVTCMKDYANPTMREMPSHVILHDEKNDEPTKKAPDQIAENIDNLAIKLKRNCDVAISGNTARNDQYQKKVADVNWE